MADKRIEEYVIQVRRPDDDTWADFEVVPENHDPYKSHDAYAKFFKHGVRLAYRYGWVTEDVIAQ